MSCYGNICRLVHLPRQDWHVYWLFLKSDTYRLLQGEIFLFQQGKPILYSKTNEVKRLQCCIHTNRTNTNATLSGFRMKLQRRLNLKRDGDLNWPLQTKGMMGHGNASFLMRHCQASFEQMTSKHRYPHHITVCEYESVCVNLAVILTCTYFLF